MSDKMTHQRIIRKMNEDLNVEQFLQREESRPNARIAQRSQMKQSISLQEHDVYMPTPLYPSVLNPFPSDVLGLALRLESDLGVDDLVGSDLNSWKDQSGNGNDASAPAAANRPAYGSNQLNGIDVLTFDGANSKMGGDITYPAGDTPTTYFIVAVNKADYATAGDGGVFCLGENPGAVADRRISSYCFETGSRDAIRLIGGNVVFPNSTNNTAFIITCRYQGGGVEWELWRNGSPISSSSSSTGTMNFQASTKYSIGIHRDINSAFDLFNGDIAAILTYSTDLAASQINQLGNYLSTKFGTSWIDL